MRWWMIVFLFLSRIASAEVSFSDIREEYAQMAWTAEQPFIKVDPFGRNPLAALILFPSSQPVEVTLRVAGKDGAPDLVHTIKGFRTEHEIPVLGLYPNHVNTVELTLTDRAGAQTKQSFTLKTKRVNRRAFYVVTEKTDPDQNRFHFLLEGVVFDEFGNMRFDFDSGKMVWYRGGELIEESRNAGLTRYSLLGEKLQHYPWPEGFVSFSHGLAQKPNGNFLVVGSFKNKKAVFENEWHATQRDFVIELDYHTGALVKTWDFSNLLNPDRSLVVRSSKLNYGMNNWCHMNAVDYDAAEKSVIVSCKHAGLVAADDETGGLKWVFGPKTGFDKSGRDGKGPAFFDKVLTAVDAAGKPYEAAVQEGKSPAADFKWPVKTHHVKVAGPSLISVFDNAGRLYRSDIHTTPTSQAVLFAVDSAQKTVRQVWRQPLEDFSEVGSSVLYDPNREEVVVFVSQIKDEGQRGLSFGKITRFDFNTRKKLFEALVYRGGDTYFYRVDSFDFYPEKKLKSDFLRHKGKQMLKPVFGIFRLCDFDDRCFSLIYGRKCADRIGGDENETGF